MGGRQLIGAYRLHEHGGPEAMQWEQVELGPPTGAQVLVRHTAVGLNYIDTYHRSGLYPLPLPSRLGVEAAGVVEAAGPDADVEVGARVAYAGALGAYGEANLVAADRLVRVPGGVGDELAAASLLKGLTACYLLTRTFSVQAGHSVLVHAAAGGVGLILCQWARYMGATVIGTAGSEAKAELARQAGAQHVILYREEDVAARVKELTDGVGVNVAYDAVGKDTFQSTLDSLARLGMFVSYGNASGPAPDVPPGELARRGSLFFTRPSLYDYSANSEDLQAMAGELFRLMADGILAIHIKQRYPLAELVQAHRDLEARATTGSTVIDPA